MRLRSPSPSTEVSPAASLTSLRPSPSRDACLTLGMLCPGWFDLSTLDKLTNSEHDDEKGMMRTLKAVDALIQAEVDAGIPENRIIVGGFSQGGAMSILTGLSGKRKLGGVIALSTWIPLNHKIKEVSLIERSRQS